MTIPDKDLTYMITNTKVNYSYYDLAEINNAYSCPTGELINKYICNYATTI
jgi:hypothetical protein